MINKKQITRVVRVNPFLPRRVVFKRIQVITEGKAYCYFQYYFTNLVCDRVLCPIDRRNDEHND